MIIPIIFIIFHNLSKKQNISKEQKLNDKSLIKNKEEIKANNSNKYNVESIKKNPYLYTEYILTLLKKNNNLDLTKFNKNINKTKHKIYDIINNKNENKDLYIILSSIYGAFLADSMGSFCEFKPFNKNNHLSIFNINSHSIFKPGK